MGRPRKEIDVGVMFHMIKNKASVSYLAKHFGVHRDTIYANYGEALKQGKEAYYKAVYARVDEVIRKYEEEKALRESIQKPKRRPRGLHPSFWRF